MKKLVIFDLDGTLLETLVDLSISVNYALHKKGHPTHDIEKYRYFVGNGVDKLIERSVPINNRNEASILEVKALFMEYYSKHKQDNTAPYKGIITLVDKLKDKGIKMAVATNKFHDASVELVENYFGKDTFGMILGQVSSRPVKPDPSIVNEILSKMGFSKYDTLYIGDSEVDMATAANSGIESVGVSWGFRPESELRNSGATYIANKPEDIISIIERNIKE